MSFVAPVVAMELKTGGAFQTNYRVGAKVGDPGTITNTVLAYVPMQMFAMRIALTEVFPREEANTLFSVLTMEEAGPGRVKISGPVDWKTKAPPKLRQRVCGRLHDGQHGTKRTANVRHGCGQPLRDCARVFRR